MTSVEGTMKNISKILLLSTSCIICYEAGDVYASFISDTVPRSGIHIYTTQPHLTSGYPHLSSAQSGNRHNTAPSLSTGLRSQNNPVNCFGEPSNETFLWEGEKRTEQKDIVGIGWGGYELKNSSLLSLTGLIPPRELQPDKVRGVLAPPTQGEDNKLNVFKTASVCFITDAGRCDGRGWENPDNPTPPGPDNPDIPPIDPIVKCEELGYKKDADKCGTGFSPAGFCPFDKSKVKECICSEDCPQNYQKQPCGSGMIQTGETTPNCQKCYKCTVCEDICPNGYSLDRGICNEASSYKTECGTPCYKIISNICSSGSLEAPEENENQKNKIVAYTNCQKPCFKSFSDVCPNGYSKISASSGKCYDTANTDFGTVCRKEIKCCTPLSSERNCTYGEQSCSDGCGGTRTCCKSAPPRPTCRTCWHSCRYTSQKVNTNQTQHMAWCSSTTTCSDGSSRTGGGVHGYVTGVNNGGKMCYSPECDSLLKQAVINHINNGDYEGCE